MLTSPQDHWRIERKEWEVWSEKDEKKNFGPIREGEKTKKNLFGNKNFHKTLVVGGWWELRGWEVGGWAVRTEKSVRTVGWLGR